MPGFLLHVGAVVSCAHGGFAVPTQVDPRVTVSGQPIVTIAAYAVTGCPLVPPALPCVLAQWLTGATRLTANGRPLLLADSQAICEPTGTPLLIAATQKRVFGR